MDFLVRIFLGFIVVGAFGAISYLKKLVNFSGLIMGFIVGFTVFVFPQQGLELFLLLLTFHLTAGLFTKYKYNVKNKLGVAEEKKGARAWTNVFANGLIPAALAFMEGMRSDPVFVYGFVGAVSSAMADTLSNEIGVLYKYKPRMITNLKEKVNPGTSGAISPLGEAVIALSGLLIGFMAYLAGLAPWFIIPVSLVSAFIGNTVDSFLGATVQAIYYCENCRKETEKKVHSCGSITKLVRGNEKINNHVVNFFMSLTGCLTGILLYYFFI